MKFFVVILVLNIFALSNALVYQYCNQAGQVAITFDDGPDPWNTRGLLDIFKEKGVKTTFFLNGIKNQNESMYRETVARAFNEGHSIGSHSLSHLDMTTLNADQIRAEIQPIHDLIYDIIGKNITIFRPPYGSYNDLLKQIAEEEFGYDLIIWNISTEDWSHPEDVEAGVQAWKDALATDQYSSYIGLHHDWTAGALELARRTIDYVQSQGFRIVNMNECIGTSG